jgi:hypothetical protein
MVHLPIRQRIGLLFHTAIGIGWEGNKLPSEGFRISGKDTCNKLLGGNRIRFDKDISKLGPMFVKT